VHRVRRNEGVGNCGRFLRVKGTITKIGTRDGKKIQHFGIG
jgi:hypothetical protein